MVAVTNPLLAIFLPVGLLVVGAPLLLILGIKRGVPRKIIAFGILGLGALSALLNALLLRL